MTLAEHWLRSFAPVDRRPIYEWAKENVELSAPFVIRGAPDMSISRHLMAPLDALNDDRVRGVNVLAPVRGGKSMIMDLFTAWIVVNQPGPTRVVFQDEKAAKDHAEQRGIRTLKSVKSIARYLPEDANKDRTKEIIFPSMALVYDGPAVSQLQSRGYRYVICDELWKYKPGILAEAKGRLGDFVKMGLDKLLCLSQGSDEGSDWHAQYESGVKHEWMIQCQKCAHPMLPSFRASRDDGTRWGFMFDHVTNEAGLFDIAKIVPTIRFECENCSHPHTWSARLKSEWNRTGQYVPEVTDKNPSFKSYHWTALIDYPWPELTEHYLGALNALKQGSVEPLKAFVQKYPAEFWSDAIAFNADQRPVQVCDVNSEWPEEKFRFMTIDQQAEGVAWYVIRAWAATGESRRLAFGKLYSRDEQREKQLEYRVRDNHVLKDAGFEARRIYAECCDFGWIALKGEDLKDFTHTVVQAGGKRIFVRRSYAPISRGDPERGAAGEGSRFAKLIRWSNPSIGDRLEGLKQGKGVKWSRPAPTTTEEILAEKEYDRQLSAEYKRQKIDKLTGRRSWHWHCPSGNNHLNDCERMQVLAATLTDCLPDLVATNETQAPVAETVES